MSEPTEQPLILLTGATGYVGGRLLDALQRSEHRVRCLARRPGYLENRVGESTSVVKGDLLDPATLTTALEGVDTAFYLVQSMGATRDFESRDRQAALNFAAAAQRAGVRRIVCLGGLGEAGEGLSSHLRSRQETGALLRSTGVPVIELRVSIILGSGSLSFEMIRTLVERLPVMICPRWVEVLTQPIHIADVISYLTASLELPVQGSRVFEIGGADTVSSPRSAEYARHGAAPGCAVPVRHPTSPAMARATTPVTPRRPQRRVDQEARRSGRRGDDFGVHPTSGNDPAVDRERGPRVDADAVVRCRLVGRSGAKLGRDQVRSEARRCPARARSGGAGPRVRPDQAGGAGRVDRHGSGDPRVIDLLRGRRRRGRSDPRSRPSTVRLLAVEEPPRPRREAPGRPAESREPEARAAHDNQTAIFDPVGRGPATDGIYPIHVASPQLAESSRPSGATPTPEHPQQEAKARTRSRRGARGGGGLIASRGERLGLGG